jgi:hypothetical protein
MKDLMNWNRKNIGEVKDECAFPDLSGRGTKAKCISRFVNNDQKKIAELKKLAASNSIYSLAKPLSRC